MKRLARLAGTAVLVVVVVSAIAVITRTGGADAQPVPDGIATMLDQVKTVDQRPNPPGYDRDCTRGHGCVFGPAWQEFKTLPGRNGCDARNDVLKAQMRKDTVTIKPGTNDCTVLIGTLDDPYSGREIRFRRTDPLTVQIDHVYPLAYAWDMGADRWSLEQRRTFANDAERNLLAVSGVENQAKSDKGPAEWLVPHNPAFRCTYIARFLAVALAYDLPITKADASALRQASKGCPSK